VKGLRLRLGQANIISVVLLVGASLVVGIAIAALFTTQASVVRSQVDISNIVSSEASNEFMTLVYHGYSPINSSYDEHIFIYKFVMLSKSSRNYFLVLPLITLGRSSDFLAYETPLFWRSANFYLLLPNATKGNYSLEPVIVFYVPGNRVFLSDGLALGISSVEIIKLTPSTSSPITSSYLEIKAVIPRAWSDYYLTIVTLTEISNNFYSLGQISAPLRGG